MIVGVILSILGVFSSIYGIINLTSIEGQLRSAFSGSMNPGYIWLIAGAIALIVGIIIIISKKKRNQ